MTVACPSCSARLSVPDDRAANPRLKLQCPGCDSVFALAAARAGAAPPRAGAARAPAAGSAHAGSAAAATGPPGGAAVATAAAPAVTSPPAGKGRGSSALRCANHARVASLYVCPACIKGWCEECGVKVQMAPTARLCPACETLCVPADKFRKEQEKAARRARPLSAELRTIFLYPLTDPVAFGIVAAVVAASGFIMFPGLKLLITKGILLSYTFHAVSQVVMGRRKLSLPEFRDPDDIRRPLWLGFAAFLGSNWPYLAAVMVLGMSFSVGVGELRGMALLAILLFGLAWMWSVFYAPIALMVATLSRNFIDTLNPAVGLATVRRMGELYLPILMIYSSVFLAQWLLMLPFSYIPILGTIVDGVTMTYAYLVVACTLGVAVEKKLDELGLGILFEVAD